jgi:hypothetical protein
MRPRRVAHQRWRIHRNFDGLVIGIENDLCHFHPDVGGAGAGIADAFEQVAAARLQVVEEDADIDLRCTGVTGERQRTQQQDMDDT